MSIPDLLWNLNVSDNTKYFILLSIIIGLSLFSMFYGKRKKPNKTIENIL